MTNKNNSVDNFLQSVCKFVSTEERAKDIQDELKDHINNYINEYQNNGMNIEDATLKALKQMGDPDILSNEFKEKSISSNRVIILYALMSYFIIITSINTYFYLNKINGLLDFIINIIFTIWIVPIVLTLFKTHKKSKFLGKNNPLFYVQTHKHPTYVEYIFLGYMILLIFSLILTLISTINPFDLNSFLISIRILTCIILIYGINPTFQKNIVYNEGILTFEKFIPWNKIAGYRWVKNHYKNKILYTLELKLKKDKFSNKTSIFSKGISVSYLQKSLIEEICELKGIEEHKFF